MSPYSLSIYLIIWCPKFVIIRHDTPWSGLSFVATIPSRVSLLRIRSATSGSLPRASPASVDASAAAASGGVSRGSSGRPRLDRRILLGSRRPGGGLQRGSVGRRRDSSVASALAPRLRSSISAPGDWDPRFWGHRSGHHRRCSGLRYALAARLSASASAPRVRGQRAQGSQTSSARSSRPAPAHAVDRRRRAFARAAHQRHQVLPLPLTCTRQKQIWPPTIWTATK